MRSPLAALVLRYALATVAIACAEASPTITATVQWDRGIVELEATLALDPAQSSLVRAKADARSELQSRLSAMLVQSLSPLLVDSSQTMGELLQSDPSFFGHLDSLALSASATEEYLSQDLSALLMRWQLPLFGSQGIATPLFPAQAQPVHRPLGFVASRPFSGLLIFAQGKLPAIGKGGAEALQPALFPRIWDEDMNLVLERANCKPDALAARGMVAYVRTLDEPVIAIRAGTSPLRVAARAVFGTNPVDLVISREAARQLLSVPENVQTITEGRIVIVY